MNALFSRHSIDSLDNAGMDDKRAKRSWFRWSAITWLVLLTTTGALINVNLDAGDEGGIQLVPPPPREHGWPMPFLVRGAANTPNPSGMLRLALPAFGDDSTSSLTGLPPPSRWPFDATPIALYSPRLLTIDVLIALTILALAGVAVERWSRRRANPDQFSLKTLLTIVAWTATCAALTIHLSLKWDVIVSHVSVAVLVLSIALAWAGCIDCVGMALGKLAGVRRP